MPSAVKYVQSSDGTLIYAEAEGCPRNPHVVFIHEATLSSRAFDELFLDARLTDHLYLVRYDLRFHGKSSTTKGSEDQFSILFGNDYAAVASVFALQRPILVAWGFGAAVVADICTHVNPLSISGVVYVAPFPFLGQSMRHMVTPRMLGIAQRLAASRDAGIAGRAKTEWVDGMFAGPSRLVPGALKALWLGRSISQDTEITTRLFSDARPFDPTRVFEAGRKGLPLMLLVGSEDALVDGTAVVRELRRHFRAVETHVVQGSSHAVFVDQRDEFVRLLLVFVGRLAVMTLMQ